MRSIFGKFLIPTVLILCISALVILNVSGNSFETSFEEQIITQTNHNSQFIAQSVESFMDKAYKLSEELANSSAILSMQTEQQTPVVQNTASRNDYFELIYVQNMDGDQTSRSSGDLGNRANRWWFQEMLTKKEAFVSKSYYSVSTNMACASIFIPLWQDQQMIGIFATDIKLASLKSTVEQFSDLENGKITFIIDGEGVVVAHPESVYYEELYNYKTLTRTVTVTDENGETKHDEAGNIVTEELSIEISSEYADIINAVMNGESGNDIITDRGRTYYASYAPVALGGTSDSWSVITLQDKATAMQVIDEVNKAGTTATVVAVIIAIILIMFITHTLTTPIKTCLNRLTKLADGDLSSDIPKSDKKDEIAQLQNTLVRTIQSLNSMIFEITNYVQYIDSGDYTRDMKKTFPGDFNILATSLASISSTMRDTLAEINYHCDAITQNVRILDLGSRQLSDGTTNQASAVEELTATLLDISDKISANAEDSNYSNNRMASVRDHAMDSTGNLDTLAKAMAMIENNSNEISNISRLIQNIASQTNLLSMNASVEATRAGEAGKGFDVVASEIRSLAERCTEATQSTAELISKTCNNIQEGLQALQITTDSIQHVADESLETSNYLHNIAKASQEQSESIIQITTAIEQISEVTQNNSMTASESARISNDIKQQILSLGELLNQYKY